MIIHWPHLLGALVLLWPPASPFHGRHVRYRAISRHWDRHLKQITSLKWHYIDFVRAALGAWLLAQAFARMPEAQGAFRYAHLIAPAIVLLVATMLQTFVCREIDSAHAAFGFAAGLVVGYFPPAIGGFALLLATTIVVGARKPFAFFPALALAVCATGFLFEKMRFAWGLAAVGSSIVVPWLCTLMFQRTMLVAYQGTPHGAGSTSPIPGKHA